ncbi:BamA/TamA family outer membrane protein [Sulfurospirillum sp.]|nr:BamA/TamA family outer membrane protein [Sulfurospirillum sp.]
MKAILVLLFLFSSLAYANLTPLYFKGNNSINQYELYTAIGLDKPFFYQPWKDDPSIEMKSVSILTQTIKNFYKSKGFFNAQVSSEEKNNAIFIVIEEKEPIIIASIEISSKLDIKTQVPFKVGDIFDAEQLTQSKKDIKILYSDNSYCNADLNSKAWIDIEKDKAYITYEAIPNTICYVKSINITSPKDIDEKIIKSLLLFKEKDKFSTGKISDTYKNIYGYEGISKVIINTNIDNNNSVNISVDVSQNEKPIRFEGGLGISSNEGLMGSLGVKHRNFFGNLKTISLETRLTQIKQTVKTNFDMPLAHRNSTGAEFGFENEEFTGYKESRVFASMYLKQRKLPHTLQESIIFDNSLTYDSNDQVLFPEGSLFITSPKLQWDYDTRDKILDPRKGYFLHSEVMGSIQSDISNASYYKAKLSGGYIFPLTYSQVALRASFGSLKLYDGEIPASYRFYAGGMNSNRAYNYNKLGPTNSKGDPLGFDSIFETTIEYRFPIYGPFKGVFFNDNTFVGRDDLLSKSEKYYSAGIGFRYKTPVGPLAIDFGFDIENPRDNFAFHFRVGELF